MNPFDAQHFASTPPPHSAGGRAFHPQAPASAEAPSWSQRVASRVARMFSRDKAEQRDPGTDHYFQSDFLGDATLDPRQWVEASGVHQAALDCASRPGGIPATSKTIPAELQQIVSQLQQTADCMIGHQIGQLEVSKRTLERTLIEAPETHALRIYRYTATTVSAFLSTLLAQRTEIEDRVRKAIDGRDKFMRDEGITRAVLQPPHWSWPTARAVVLVSVESITNAQLFRDATATGGTGGVIVACSAALLNVVLATAAGYVFGRSLHRAEPRARLLVGRLGTGLFAITAMAGLIFWGVLRHLVANGAGTLTLGDAANHIFDLAAIAATALDGGSWLLILLGGLTTCLSFYSGIHEWRDPIPGYHEIDRVVAEAQQARDDFFQAKLQDLEAVYAGAREDLKQIVKEVRHCIDAFDREAAQLEQRVLRHGTVTTLILATAILLKEHFVQTYLSMRPNAPLPTVLRERLHIDTGLQPAALDARPLRLANQAAWQATTRLEHTILTRLHQDEEGDLADLERWLKDPGDTTVTPKSSLYDALDPLLAACASLGPQPGRHTDATGGHQSVH